jgi:hypothetical protein
MSFESRRARANAPHLRRLTPGGVMTSMAAAAPKAALKTDGVTGRFRNTANRSHQTKTNTGERK